MDNLKSGPESRVSSERRSAGSSSIRNEQPQQKNQFKGKHFYFDNECRRDQRFDKLVKQLTYVGASVELFHTKKITHYISVSGRKPQAQPPGPSRRSGGTARPLSRKDLMLAAVKGNQSTSPPANTIEENRGVRYYAFDGLLRLVAKQVKLEKSRRALRRGSDANKSLDSPVKSPKVAKPKKPTTSYPQTSRRSLFIETKSPEKKSKKIYLRDNFSKITDESERYRPVFKDQMPEQMVSIDRVAYNKCPYVGFMTDQERKEKRDSMNLQKQKKHEQTEGTSASAKTTSAIVATAKNDASKTLATMWKNGGTCEICQYFRYEDPEEHFESQTHKKNVQNYELRFKSIDNKSFALQSGLTKQQEKSLSKIERRMAIIRHRNKEVRLRQASSTTLAELERMKSPILAEETPFTDKSSQKLREKKPSSDQNANRTNKLSDKSDEKEDNAVLSPMMMEVEEENQGNEKALEVVPKMDVENYNHNEESAQNNKDFEEKQENEEEIVKEHVEVPINDIGERGIVDAQTHADSQEKEDEEEDTHSQTTSNSLSEDEDPMMMDATEALKALKDEERTEDSWEITSRMSEVPAAREKKNHSQTAIPCKQKTIQLYQFEDSSDEEDGHVVLKKSTRKKLTDKSFNLDTTQEEDEDDMTNSFNLPREKPRIIHPKRKRSDDFTDPNGRDCPPSPDSRSPARKKPDVNNRSDGFNRTKLCFAEEQKETKAPDYVITDSFRDTSNQEQMDTERAQSPKKKEEDMNEQEHDEEDTVEPPTAVEPEAVEEIQPRDSSGEVEELYYRSSGWDRLHEDDVTCSDENRNSYENFNLYNSFLNKIYNH